MTDTPLLAALRQSADPKAVDRIEHLVEHGADRDLNRINALAFAAEHNLDSQKTIAAFLHAAQLGNRSTATGITCAFCAAGTIGKRFSSRGEEALPNPSGPRLRAETGEASAS